MLVLQPQQEHKKGEVTIITTTTRVKETQEIQKNQEKSTAINIK